MQANATSLGTFPINTTIGAYLRVVMSGGYLAAASAEQIDLGTMKQGNQTSGVGSSSVASVVFRSAEGTVYMIASEAITQYARVYGADGGKIQATPNANPIGFALTAATADGDQVEVLRTDDNLDMSTVVAKTADYDVEVEDTGKTFTTVGAAGAVTFRLPPAVVGLRNRYRVGAAQELRLDPDGTETIALPSTGVQGAAGKYLVADADGETVDIECTKAGEWSVFGFTGTWTAEA
ncbi:MAG: DUF2190 family protein [Planctomycetaceae bacterium]|nr:DUF2190 family protein [Planctomycetaceae bacterium]